MLLGIDYGAPDMRRLLGPSLLPIPLHCLLASYVAMFEQSPSRIFTPFHLSVGVQGWYDDVESSSDVGKLVRYRSRIQRRCPSVSAAASHTYI